MASINPSTALLACLLICILPGAEVPDKASPVTTVAPDTYKLFAGDRIVVNVFGHDDLNHFVRIPQSGAVSFPLIGALDPVAGRTVESLRAEIQSRLGAEYIVDPRVTLSVSEFAPRSAFVTGSVLRPDSVALEPLQDSTAQQAIARCGGFTEDADRARTIVLRDDPASAGSKTALVVPDIAAGGGDVILLPGDLIVVPRLDRVYVLGRVSRAGYVNMPSQERLTVSKAISLAGGFDRFARSSQVQLLRPGSPPAMVDVDAVLSGDRAANDPELKPGDTLFVPASRF